MNGTNDKKQVLRRLFFSTLSLSAFTFGGGYVIVTLLKKKFVDECHWIEEDEMLDLVAIAQSAQSPALKKRIPPLKVFGSGMCSAPSVP